MQVDLLARVWSSEIFTLVRFCFVGTTSTLIFVAVSWLLIWLNFMPATLVTVIAMATGIAASYVGHYYFTYRKGSGQHTFFGPRFFAVTGIIGAANLMLTYVAVEALQFSAYLVSGVAAILYPIASLMLHHLWTFRRGK